MTTKPIKISIVKKKNDDYFRLKYTIGDTMVTTSGFRTKEELAEIIKRDTTFKLEVD